MKIDIKVKYDFNAQYTNKYWASTTIDGTYLTAGDMVHFSSAKIKLIKAVQEYLSIKNSVIPPESEVIEIEVFTPIREIAEGELASSK